MKKFLNCDLYDLYDSCDWENVISTPLNDHFKNIHVVAYAMIFDAKETISEL